MLSNPARALILSTPAGTSRDPGDSCARLLEPRRRLAATTSGAGRTGFQPRKREHTPVLADSLAVASQHRVASGKHRKAGREVGTDHAAGQRPDARDWPLPASATQRAAAHTAHLGCRHNPLAYQLFLTHLLIDDLTADRYWHWTSTSPRSGRWKSVKGAITTRIYR
jgi:hypothetical protein